MQPDRREEPLIPSFLQGRWGLVTLGRWVGIFVLLSAFGLAIWEFFIFQDSFDASDSTAFQAQVFFSRFWRTVVQIGSWGVVIILLAELVDRFSGYDEDQEG